MAKKPFLTVVVPDPALPVTRAELDRHAGPYALAQAFATERFAAAGVLMIRFWRGEFWIHDGAAYRPRSKDDMRAAAYDWLHDRGSKATKRSVDDLVDALRAVAKLPDVQDAPRWIADSCVDPTLLIAFRNGLLDVQARKLYSPTAEFFNLNALEFAYAEDAPAPQRWLTFLAEIFPDDAIAIDTLAEIFGYSLMLDTRQQKAFLIIGPPRSGKGTIARVLRYLVGAANVCAPMLANLGAHFGLQELIGKLLAIISDARLSGRADMNAIVENMLRLSGEDPVTAPRKFLPDFNGHLPVRFLVLSNEVPALADASGALPSRFVILRLSRSFLGHEDTQLLDHLLAELPGILLWALNGLDRLNARGHFLQPGSGDDLAHDMRALASPLRQFVDDMCHLDHDPETSIAVSDLFDAWRAWCRDEGRESAWTKELFGSRLRTVVPHVRVARGPRQFDGKRRRAYVGVRLRQYDDPEPGAMEGN